MSVAIFEAWESEIRGYCRAYPTVFKTAENARQIDENGKSYIDFFAGAGVLNFGHNNPHMKKAVIDYIQANGVTHSLDMYTTAKRDFIEGFVNTIMKPRGMKHRLQFMGPTGTNAVEAALKIARRVTGRETVFAFSHGFHGMTLGALACTANDYFRNASGVPLNHVHRLPFEGVANGSDIQALRKQIEDPSSGIKPPAAFILEPIQAEGGVNIATAQWLREVQQLAKDVGALFILDDIQAGCGRTGSYFSFDDMGLDPDVITLAKGLGGFGTPIAMNMVKAEHDKHWQPGEHTGTFRGQNISFIAGREALRYFEDDKLMTDVKRKGDIMRGVLDELAATLKGQGLAVRGKGMMQALDVQDGAKAKEIAKTCFENGMLFGPCGTQGKVLKLIPPLTIADEDLNEGLQIFKDAVLHVMKG
jgi:diaminobutyrate-2-oxoglutarate transaminase